MTSRGFMSKEELHQKVASFGYAKSNERTENATF